MNQSSAVSSITRREALRKIALIGGSVFSAPAISSFSMSHAVAQLPSGDVESQLAQELDGQPESLSQEGSNPEGGDGQSQDTSGQMPATEPLPGQVPPPEPLPGQQLPQQPVSLPAATPDSSPTLPGDQATSSTLISPSPGVAAGQELPAGPAQQILPSA
ncbi:MAG: hypothetical protein ACT4OM_07245 [Actinomycetota bacterium]